MPSVTIGLVQAIERLQRAMPRNPLVVDLGAQMDAAMAADPVTLQDASGVAGNVTAAMAGECPICAARAKAGRARVTKHRAKKAAKGAKAS